ncbi:hypothetical protein Cni_G10556 [Canna indica]|uniref:Pentatricopeptide repeat-containing protein n=1 Tax=Canna indica TaxID=4628 RepID=A0AAQ3K4A3_9LILI|nr:hypothetical protein Cni_G10556 [Canna indica]
MTAKSPLNAHAIVSIPKRRAPSPPPAETVEGRLISVIHSSKSVRHLKGVQAHLLRLHLPLTPRLAAQLVTAACSPPLRATPYALALFRRFPPSPPIFDALVRGLCDCSLFSAALSHFVLISRSGLRPSRLAFPFALKSAAALPSPHHVPTLHAAAAKASLDLDPFVRTSLVDAYVKLGLPDRALVVFDDTPEWHKDSNVLLWNVSINACCLSGHLEGAKKLFDLMPERTMASWNSLMQGYMRHGDAEAAVGLFHQMAEKNVVSWTTLVSGFLKLDEFEQALSFFDKMLEEGMRPNEFTISSALSACARMGALDRGIRIHDFALKNGFKEDGAIGTALVDMYSKCGKIEIASQLFDHMERKDLLTWTAMILGWAIHGHCTKALQYFENMKCACIEPDEGAFLAVLMACSHSGKVRSGLQIFDSMRFDFKIKPNIKHYTCMVDLFGRAGQLDRAISLMETMPMEPDFVLWGALFNACRANKIVELAEVAAEKLLKLRPKHQGSFIFLSNMYAGAGRWDDADKVRVSMKERGVEKVPGWSYIEVDGVAHHFVAGDQSHPRSTEIYQKLEFLATKATEQGYKPNTDWVLHNIEDEDKVDSLACRPSL